MRGPVRPGSGLWPVGPTLPVQRARGTHRSAHWRVALARDLDKDAAERAHQLVDCLVQRVQVPVGGISNRGFERVGHDRDLLHHTVA
jgi:hypothetical protein